VTGTLDKYCVKEGQEVESDTVLAIINE